MLSYVSSTWFRTLNKSCQSGAIALFLCDYLLKSLDLALIRWLNTLNKSSQSGVIALFLCDYLLKVLDPALLRCLSIDAKW